MLARNLHGTGTHHMGLGGISIWQLVIVLLIVVMLFGTRRFKSLGTDLGDAIKGFRHGLTSDQTHEPLKPQPPRD